MPKVKENNCTCQTCEKGFYANKYKIEHGQAKYCSKDCFYAKIRKVATIAVCKACGNEFIQKNYDAKRGLSVYCSRTCSQSHRKKDKVFRICKICGKEFFINESALKFGYGIVCSKKCRHENLRISVTGENHHNWKGGKIERTCKFCNKTFLIHPSELNRKNGSYGNFCSKSCAGKYRSGDKSSSWQGGITPISKQDRSGYKISDWRISVFERDNYICQRCNKKGGTLNAHHIIPFSVDKSLRFEISNGITLCEKCHKKEHIRLSKESSIQSDIFDIYQRRKSEHNKQ